MNEQMLALYKQAHVPSTQVDPSNNMTFASTCFSAEKFAELIIEECVGCFADDLASMRDYTGKTCQWMIKEHFGIEK